jgi:hypothetical protein
MTNELKDILIKNQTNDFLNFKFADNEKAHEVLNEILKKLISRIESVEKYIQENVNVRLDNIERFVTTELIGPKSLEYKPSGAEEYLGLGKNLDLIYERLNKLEDVTFDNGK